MNKLKLFYQKHLKFQMIIQRLVLLNKKQYNEQGVGAFGVSVIRAKLMAFGIAGFLAGCAGALHVVHQQAFVPTSNVSGLGSSIRVFIAAIVEELAHRLEQ